MRRLNLACALLLIGVVAVLPFDRQVQSATGNYKLSTAPAIRLVYLDSYLEGSYDTRWKIEGTAASIETESGKLSYVVNVPETITSGGSPCTLSAKARASKDNKSGLQAHISFFGEIDSKAGEPRELFVTAESGQEKTDSLTVTAVSGDRFSEGSYPLLKIRMDGGQASLNMVFRYSVEHASTGGGIRLEYDINRPGQDYQNFNLPQAQPELCSAQCAADPNCNAFTYVKPGFQGPSARCWLKSGVPPATRNSCCVSGFKG